MASVEANEAITRKQAVRLLVCLTSRIGKKIRLFLLAAKQTAGTGRTIYVITPLKHQRCLYRVPII